MDQKLFPLNLAMYVIFFWGGVMSLVWIVDCGHAPLNLEAQQQYFSYSVMLVAVVLQNSFVLVL